MATEYGKRLNSALDAAGLNQKELVAKTGLSQSTVSSAINRGNGSSYTALFAKTLDVDAHWLATGEGAMRQSTDELPQKMRAALATVAGLLRTIPEDQWGNALMEIAEVLQKDRRL